MSIFDVIDPSLSMNFRIMEMERSSRISQLRSFAFSLYSDKNHYLDYSKGYGNSFNGLSFPCQVKSIYLRHLEDICAVQNFSGMLLNSQKPATLRMHILNPAKAILCLLAIS